MMGKNHRMVTSSFVFAFTLSVPATIIACASASFPDRIEKIIRVNHRTYSHWFPFYLIPMIVIYTYLINQGTFLMDYSEWLSAIQSGNKILIGMNMGFWFLLGGLAHIIEDSVCGRIPLVNPTKAKPYFKFFETDSWFENLFAIGISLLILMAKVPIVAQIVKGIIN